MGSALEAARALRDAIGDPPAAGQPFVANTLAYAWEPHADYVARHAPAGHTVEALWVGMNPGPWGMAQTGVPFGCVPRVRDFLGVRGAVSDPGTTHPDRPILGFACTRTEVSGDRLWGAIEAACGTPAAFFAHTFVTTYCPVIWQSATGANVPPDKLPGRELTALFAACDRHLVDLVDALRPRTVIGVGAWAEGRIQRAMTAHGRSVRVGRLLHPSPASPAANRGWAAEAHAQLVALGHPLAR